MKAILVNSSDDVDRRVLLAERDAARRERLLAELRADLAKMQRRLELAELEAAEYLRQIGRLEDQFGMVFRSPSWRWTAPLRRVTDIVGRLRTSLGGPPPPVLPSPAPPKVVEEAPSVPLSLRERAIIRRLQRAV